MKRRRTEPVIPYWRRAVIDRQLDTLSSLSSAYFLSPDPDDSEEVLMIKKRLVSSIKLHVYPVIDQINLALDERAQRGCSDQPYIPAVDEADEK